MCGLFFCLFHSGMRGCGSCTPVERFLEGFFVERYRIYSVQSLQAYCTKHFRSLVYIQANNSAYTD